MTYGGASFHMFICHMYVFFGEVSAKAFSPIFNQVGALLFLYLSFKSSFYILNNSPLDNVYFANIPPSLWLVSNSLDIE